MLRGVRLRTRSPGWRFSRKALSDAIEKGVNHRRSVQREHLTHEQPANHGDAQRPSKLRTNAGAKRQWQTAKKRGHGGHHDGPETKQARLVNGVSGTFSVVALRFERKVDHHNSVFLDDADQQY